MKCSHWKQKKDALVILSVVLTAKLDFVLSFRQLNNVLAQEPVIACTSTDVVTAATTNNQPATYAAQRPCSSVVKSNKRPANFCEDAVAAVYVDQWQKDSCKNSSNYLGSATSSADWQFLSSPNCWRLSLTLILTFQYVDISDSSCLAKLNLYWLLWRIQNMQA